MFVVGGGGSGGYYFGGGGGGADSSSGLYSVTPASNINVTVGGGGAAITGSSTTAVNGADGSTSSVTIGANTYSVNGGKGGGGCTYTGSGSSITCNNTNLGGVAGGTHGGAGGQGRYTTSISALPSTGSTGTNSSITGSNVSYGNGGDGGDNNSSGGDGASDTGAGGNGTGYLGYSINSGAGAAGVVIFRYSDSVPIVSGSISLTSVNTVGQTIAVASNTTHTFSRVVNVTYQWQKATGGSYSNISGATSNSYTIQSSDDGATLQLVTSYNNSGGSATITATSIAVVYAAPVIGGASFSGGTTFGSTESATATSVSGSATSLTYTWYRASTQAGTYSAISGATSGTYLTTTSDVNQWIKVTITISNDGGSANATSSPAQITGIQLNTPNSPTASAKSGSTTAITVSYTTVANATSYTVRVYKSGVQVGSDYTNFSSGSNISGLTANTAYTVTTLAIGDGTNYLNSNESSAATVTTNGSAATPSITSQPQSATKNTGQSVTFSVTATVTDSGTVSYQWNKGGTAISGATSSSYSIASVGSSDAGNYTVIVTNTSNGTSSSVTSNTATLTYNQTYTYSITFHDSNSGSASGQSGGTAPNSQSGSGVTSIPLNQNTLQIFGYNFLGWATSSGTTTVTYNDQAVVSVSANINLNLYPVWQARTMAIYYSNGGKFVDNTTVQATGDVSSGAFTVLQVAPSNPYLSGYKFMGWGFDGSNVITQDYPINQLRILYAVWAVAYEATFDANGGQFVDNTTIQVTSPLVTNTDAILYQPSSPILSGFKFNGWALSTSPQIVVSSAFLQSNIRLVAVWTTSYQATFDANGGLFVDNTTVQITQPLSLNIDAFGYLPSNPLRTGYDFQGWAASTSPTTVITTLLLQSNATLVAVWKFRGGPLTITANNLNANYLSSYSDPSSTSQGLANGDSIGTITYQYQGTGYTIYSLSSTKPVNVGTYLIIPSALTLNIGIVANYKITYVNGLLTISGSSTNGLSGISVKSTNSKYSSTELISNYSKNTLTYSAYVNADTSAVVVLLNRDSGTYINCSIQVNNSGFRNLNFTNNIANSGSVPLPSSSNTITVRVSATDSSTTTYSINILRDQSTNSETGGVANPTPVSSPVAASTVNFGSVTFSANGLQVPISPNFSTSVLTYSANFTVNESAAQMNLTFNTPGITLRLQINNSAFRTIGSGGVSQSLPINKGSNTAVLRVQSADGSLVDYTFNLFRASS
jgi:hypothetical protein